MWGSNPRAVRSWPEPKSVALPIEPPRHPRDNFFLNPGSLVGFWLFKIQISRLHSWRIWLSRWGIGFWKVFFLKLSGKYWSSYVWVKTFIDSLINSFNYSFFPKFGFHHIPKFAHCNIAHCNWAVEIEWQEKYEYHKRRKGCEDYWCCWVRLGRLKSQEALQKHWCKA